MEALISTSLLLKKRRKCYGNVVRYIHGDDGDSDSVGDSDDDVNG